MTPPLPPDDLATDACGVRVFHDGAPLFTLVSAYVPPIANTRLDAREQRFSPESLRPLHNDDPLVIAADLNAHHITWDPVARPTPLGREFFEWVIGEGLTTLNTGAPTRWAGLHGTAPDVTAAPAAWLDAMRWRVGDNWGSDHRALHYTVPAGRLPPRPRPPPRPNFKRADWAEYGRTTERRLVALERRLPRLDRVTHKGWRLAVGGGSGSKRGAAEGRAVFFSDLFLF
jgi:hypothetical protein